jgi:hypothetical protein
MSHKLLQHSYISLNLLNTNKNYTDTKKGHFLIDSGKLMHSNGCYSSGTKRWFPDLDEKVKLNDL